uniref:LLM class F420-dependent oxidoreductase n=1 Tax=Thermosporothrix sp. COM3 TaxID=2490863 RepID=A0A455SFG3_9CHLR|nr:LLM class F420-dependent oxidoreductase [Thermosporothrix sp. COM3]
MSQSSLSLRERVGVAIFQSSDTVEAVRSIREAEAAGVQQAWFSTGSAGLADVLTMLSAAAIQTERIKLGTAIVPVPARHPLVMAQQALAIHDIAPGRLLLGVGSGDRALFEHGYGLPQATPLKHLREYLQVLRSVLYEGQVEYRGTFFQVSAVQPRTAPIPLLIPALGLKAFELAGEIADGALAAFCPVPYLLEQARPAIQAGAEKSKRPAPPIIAGLPVVFSTDERTVQGAVRVFVQQISQTSTYAHMFTLAGWGAAIQGDTKALDALALELAIYGTEEAIRDRIQKLLQSGIGGLQLINIALADPAKEQQHLYRLIGSL